LQNVLQENLYVAKQQSNEAAKNKNQKKLFLFFAASLLRDQKIFAFRT